MNKIIMISGASGSGKSTVADFLKKQYGYQVRPLAREIKNRLARMTGLKLEEIEVKKNDLSSEVRTALQAVGEAACEKDLYYWCKAVNASWHIQESGIVIPDLRKMYEKPYFEKLGWPVVHFHIDRPELDMSLPKYKHKTEKELDLLRKCANAILLNTQDSALEFLDANRTEIETCVENG